jgi:hypothetical protein
MKAYRFLKTIPYGDEQLLGLPVERRLLFLDPDGIENPECPCVVINDLQVMLPNHEMWHLGGEMRQWTNTAQLRTILPYYGTDLTNRIVCLLIWRNQHGLNPISVI